LLFDRAAAGGGHLRLIPDRRLEITDFELPDADWEELSIPVDMAFFFHSSDAERVQAFYPSPMGATESALTLEAWERVEESNPVLSQIESDVEALLVNRARGARRYWLVPIDECYGLVGLIRTRWKGLSGGEEVWVEIDRFFGGAGPALRPVTRQGNRNQTTAANVGGGEEGDGRHQGKKAGHSPGHLGAHRRNQTGNKGPNESRAGTTRRDLHGGALDGNQPEHAKPVDEHAEPRRGSARGLPSPIAGPGAAEAAPDLSFGQRVEPLERAAAPTLLLEVRIARTGGDVRWSRSTWAPDRRHPAGPDAETREARRCSSRGRGGATCTACLGPASA
jgi:hypothetical protein